jgi:hypothetical protein
MENNALLAELQKEEQRQGKKLMVITEDFYQSTIEALEGFRKIIEALESKIEKA